MPTERNKNLVRRMMAALDARDLDEVTANLGSEARFHGWAPDALDVGGYRATMGGLLEAFPDSRFVVHEVIAEGDYVLCRHTMRGTHRQAFLDVPASGNAVTVPAMVLFRMEGDRPVELWLNADMLGLMMQIGAITTPEASGS